MRSYIILFLITGTVLAQTGLDKLILKDGTEYSVEISDIKRIEGLDFAVIKFISRKKYKTSFELNPEEFNIPRKEDKVFIAGFPLGSNNQLKIAEGDLIAETFWGEEGYDLFYDAATNVGMSGGGVFSDLGQTKIFWSSLNFRF